MFYLSLAGYDDLVVDEKQQKIARDLISGHLRFCDDDGQLEKRPCPARIMKLLQEGDMEPVAIQLLGSAEWGSLSSREKNNVYWVMGKAVSNWERLLNRETGVLPPSV